jgi:hypothetical protein
VASSDLGEFLKRPQGADRPACRDADTVTSMRDTCRVRIDDRQTAPDDGQEVLVCRDKLEASLNLVLRDQVDIRSGPTPYDNVVEMMAGDPPLETDLLDHSVKTECRVATEKGRKNDGGKTVFEDCSGSARRQRRCHTARGRTRPSGPMARMRIMVVGHGDEYGGCAATPPSGDAARARKDPDLDHRRPRVSACWSRSSSRTPDMLTRS